MPREGALMTDKSELIQSAAKSAPEVGSLLDMLRAQPVARESFEHVNPWMATEAGQGLEGMLTSIGQFHDDTFTDKVYTTWVVEDDKGVSWSVIPFHKMLRGEMAKSGARLGDRVAILYDGEEQSESDPTLSFKLYRVAKSRVRNRI